ncbi:MetQ/NlpA family ABC transporter substrate-binding protein [Shouchella clausii]|uniref:MetQ/NlpA family ABC transporter substrate-binding protein n=1 Tax=Shouchella clausii TaxID=79880 RepID=UPI000B966620|nr:MetQ/NlpA family ABC transporter substrate-binding protein [Shouchella clausii]AST96102.1 methionine ABC transporter substrate-binding protein [Shouchella clausii]MCR1289473.1 MetQ/NlpA family ABC transporter substrate-binding protein [Shouchella clausii]MEB5473712.1 MetQ/NlpA family ABC transporter substrate-binding protein [Shouchella clausii]MEB5479278.1 MetQ/NlpA family ABC transporter substrate-binding protein [Shouchella clausii]PAD14701.1 methionine ABC transporter substrate-binding 
MTKKLLLSSVVLLLGLLAACAGEESGSEGNEQDKTVKIGAASTPHAELLEFIANDLAEQGIKLDIQHSTDGIQTNQQTADGDLDANFFQHTPYLNQVNQDAGLDLVDVAGIHIEPFGFYSNVYEAIAEVEEGAAVAIPNDPVNLSRALELLEANGLIGLSDGNDGNYSVQSIEENELRLEFKAIDGPLLPQALNDADLVAINTNYALETGLEPLKDALIIEGADSPYVNILVTTPEKAKSDEIIALSEALQTDKVKAFIEETYKGAVVPAF